MSPWDMPHRRCPASVSHLNDRVVIFKNDELASSSSRIWPRIRATRSSWPSGAIKEGVL